MTQRDGQVFFCGTPGFEPYYHMTTRNDPKNDLKNLNGKNKKTNFIKTD